MDVLRTLKLKIESQNSDYGCIKDQWTYPNQDQDVKVRNLNAFSKSPNKDIKELDVLCTFKIKIESQNSDHGSVKDQWLYPNQYQDAKPLPETSSIIQGPKSRLKGRGYFFAPSKLRCRAKIFSRGLPKTSEHIQINIKMPNPSQKHPASAKAWNQDLKNMVVLCTFKDQWTYPNQDQDAKPQSEKN